VETGVGGKKGEVVGRPPIRCIVGEGEVRSGAVVIAQVASQDVTQVALAEDNDVVETLAPNRAGHEGQTVSLAE
jgi:hypothetical protein